MFLGLVLISYGHHVQHKKSPKHQQSDIEERRLISPNQSIQPHKPKLTMKKED